LEKISEANATFRSKGIENNLKVQALNAGNKEMMKKQVNDKPKTRLQRYQPSSKMAAQSI
jgi:hypothetical protein